MHMDNICYWKRKYVLHFFPRHSIYNLTILNSQIILHPSLSSEIYKAGFFTQNNYGTLGQLIFLQLNHTVEC